MPSQDDMSTGERGDSWAQPQASKQAGGQLPPYRPARALQRLAAAVQCTGLMESVALAVAPPSTHRLPSPCINVCTMGQVLAEPSQMLCLGCLRSLPEIMEWGGADHSRQQAIWREVLARMQTHDAM